jgi:hypothetical protein
MLAPQERVIPVLSVPGPLLDSPPERADRGQLAGPPRRAARQPRTPSRPTVVPMASDAAMSSACAQRKPVGAPSPTVPVDQARGSFQMATANLGQMTQVHTPTATRKTDQPRDNTMVSEYASGPGSRHGHRCHLASLRVDAPPGVRVPFPPRPVGSARRQRWASGRCGGCEPTARATSPTTQT